MLRRVTKGLYNDWQVALREVSCLRVTVAKKQMLYQSQRIFEQGERTGRLLVWLSKKQCSSTQIASIKDVDGT